MKTIEVNDEMYEFLCNLSKEIKTQDNRGTRPPYFFQVQEEEECPVPDGFGDEVWVMDGQVLRTDEDIKETVFEYNGWEIGSKKDEELHAEMDRWDEEEVADKHVFYVDYGYSNGMKYAKEYASNNNILIEERRILNK